MAQAAIPLLVGTGIQIIGAKQGWDPRLTAFASIAAGGVAGGMASGAFAGGTAAQAATGAAATNAFNPATTGVLAGSQAGQAALASRAAQAAAFPSAASFAVPGGEVGRVLPQTPYYTANPINPQSSLTPAVAEVKAPFFDRTQYTYETRPVKLPDGTMGSEQVRIPKVDGQGNPIKGLSTADSLGVSMLDTFLQYELALAKQPPPRIPSSGGGGGGGGGGASGPAYQGGSGGKKYQVVDFYGTGGTASYQPQPI